MSKFIIVPGVAELRDPESAGGPVTDRVSFARAVGIACQTIIRTQTLDAIEVYDLREKVGRAQVGTVLELSDAEHKALCLEFRRPTQLSPVYVLGGGIEQIRAVVNAADKFPAAMVPPASEPVSAN